MGVKMKSFAGFRPRTTRLFRLGSGQAFCFGKRTQNHFARVRLFGCLRLRNESFGCATRSAKAVLASVADLVLRLRRTQGDRVVISSRARNLFEGGRIRFLPLVEMTNGKTGFPLQTAGMTVADWWGGGCIEGRTMLCLLEKHKKNCNYSGG